MERELHRLESLLLDKEKTIVLLNNKVTQLGEQLSEAQRNIQNLKAQASKGYSYEYVPPREIVQTLEAKLANSTWQIL